MSDTPPSLEIVELMGEVADLMLSDLDGLVAEMAEAEIKLTPMVGSDPALTAEMSASNRAITIHGLTMLARRDQGAPAMDVPPEALDVARTIARRDLDLAVILSYWRRGEQVAWQRYVEYANRVVSSGPVLGQLLEISSQRTFEYVDYALCRVMAEAQREREQLLGGAPARRRETVQLILDGAPVDGRPASECLGYDLARRHTAIVLWAAPPGEAMGALECTANILARTAGVLHPLTLSDGTSTLWVWLATDFDPDLDALGDAIGAAPANIRAAVGLTRPDIAGFRRSHTEALAIRNLLTLNPDGPRLGLYRDLQVTDMAVQNVDRAAEFVAMTLGPLAANTASAARLRETLRVFLDEADNAPRTAVRLHTHRNTVLQRVARATELLGRPPGERRLAIELALELALQIGPRVLTRA
jgi:DNA-binding PucR family transcriptional regulator